MEYLYKPRKSLSNLEKKRKFVRNNGKTFSEDSSETWVRQIIKWVEVEEMEPIWVLTTLPISSFAEEKSNTGLKSCITVDIIYVLVYFIWFDSSVSSRVERVDHTLYWWERKEEGEHWVILQGEEELNPGHRWRDQHQIVS